MPTTVVQCAKHAIAPRFMLMVQSEDVGHGAPSSCDGISIATTDACAIGTSPVIPAAKAWCATALTMNSAATNVATRRRQGWRDMGRGYEFCRARRKHKLVTPGPGGTASYPFARTISARAQEHPHPYLFSLHVRLPPSWRDEAGLQIVPIDQAREHDSRLRTKRGREFADKAIGLGRR